jgi:hypothetical protein
VCVCLRAACSATWSVRADARTGASGRYCVRARPLALADQLVTELEFDPAGLELDDVSVHGGSLVVVGYGACGLS